MIDRFGPTEITKEDQLVLFAFVKQLTTETKNFFQEENLCVFGWMKRVLWLEFMEHGFSYQEESSRSDLPIFVNSVNLSERVQGDSGPWIRSFLQRSMK